MFSGFNFSSIPLNNFTTFNINNGNVNNSNSNTAIFSVYAELNIDKTATQTDIKKAYRVEAMKWHPDKHQGSTNEQELRQVEDKFKKIQQAYDILSNEQERAKYDHYGDDY